MKRLFTLYFLTGCAGYNGATNNGWSWNSPDSNISSSNIEIVIATTKKVFESSTGYTVPTRAFKLINNIHFVYYEIFCSTEEPFGSNKCLGQVDYEEKEMWITLKSSCLARTSLPHELIHIFARSIGIDSSHNNSLLFKRASGPDENTVEYKAQQQLEKEL